MVDEVLPVELEDAIRARDLLLEHAAASARDALHVATMERHTVTRILSFDAGFDRFAGLERVAE